MSVHTIAATSDVMQYPDCGDTNAVARRDAVPYRFERSHRGADIAASPNGTQVSVAGRVRRRRDLGGLVFADLHDQSGIAQLVADDDAALVAIRDVSIGDWIGVTGTVITTNRGHRSVRIESVETLAVTRHLFPDSWRGIGDPEVRFRQRELDLWANPSARVRLLQRSAIIATIRASMAANDFVEVETPLLHHQAGGANARPFTTHHNALGCDLDLRIAPELFLKRLVVGGFERVFEIGRNFRNEGMSPRHNPEFTMMEVYQAYADINDMMDLTERLVQECARDVIGSTVVTVDGVQLDLAEPWQRLSMVDAVHERTGMRIEPTGDAADARSVGRSLSVDVDESWTSGRVLAEVFDQLVDRHLTGPVFVIDYPVEVSPLARAHRSLPGVTERFELFVGGRELANAFSELTDPDIQRERFEAQQAEQANGDDEAMPYDHAYLRALEYGLPPTGGLGIGIDRLVMLLTGVSNIREVIAFPTLAPEVFRDDRP